jgi:hypothetical protein
MGRDPSVKLVGIEPHQPADLGVGHSSLVAQPADEPQADVEALSCLLWRQKPPGVGAGCRMVGGRAHVAEYATGLQMMHCYVER